MIRSLIAVAGVLALAVPAASQTVPRGAKAEVVRGVEARAKLSQVINDELFSFAEIGFQEHETERYLTALLEKEGFTIERNVAGLPTGWTARRSEEHTSELTSLMRNSYGVFWLKKKNSKKRTKTTSRRQT